MSAAVRLAFAGLALAATPAFADRPPTRTPGLWETATITNAGRTMARECIDERTDRIVRQATSGVTCRNDDFKRTADGYAAGAICRSGGMSIDNKVEITGDFATFARVSTTTVMSGLPGEAGPRTFTSAIEARRLGDCQPDQRPGDVILPNGTVVNVPPAR
ncbi:DUF3617 domain-containing protein [Methylopila henanensis]|uniref:DUF3617 domain-containing protein n=1 Tax=Methylopila henanensis TaxID=873516 RepID=A0ABW4K4P1_9HYPH